MNWIKKNALMLSALAGLILFWVFSYGPMVSGEDPEATKHAIDREAAEEAALQFVQERLPEDTELTAFAMYSADRDVFGYFYKEQLLDAVFHHFRSSAPLEQYRVEVKETESGLTHLVEINPYTGQPVEWDLWTSGEAVAADQLESVGKQTIEQLGLAAAKPQVEDVDEAGGVIQYSLQHPAFKEASAKLTVRADDAGATAVTVRWETPASYMALVKKQDDWASIFGLIGFFLNGSLQLAAMIYALSQIRHVRLSRGVIMALAFGVIYCAININMYPGLKATVLGILNGEDYAPLLQSEPGAVLGGMITMLLIANLMTLLLSIGLYFSAVAGDHLSARQGWNVWPLWSDDRYGAHVSSAVWKGYLLAFVLLGFQSIIFLAAESGFRTWYTIDALQSPNNMAFPLLLPLLAWCAAISEEIVYRLFGIIALKKLLRFTFPAIVISSLIWSLGHVQYPIYPFYTRAIEVTLIGIAFAYIFLKHGILTAIFAHAVVDIIWMGISITVNQPTAEAWTAFAVYLAVPALIGLAVHWRHHRSRHIEAV